MKRRQARATEPAGAIEINLLPWREKARERRTRRFYVVVVACMALGLALGWLKAQWTQAYLDAEDVRIAHIETRLKALDRGIAEVKNLQDRREQLQTQIKLISKLQFSRPQTVSVFDQLTATLVDGAYYDRVVRQGHQLSSQWRGAYQSPGLRPDACSRCLQGIR